jgi:hypothetical protein
MRSLLVLALVACGSSHPEPAKQSQYTKQTETKIYVVDAGPDAPAPPCPARFGEGSGACSVAQQCTYPEGMCECGVESRCSGYNMSPEQQAEWNSHLVWECAKKPPAMRPDHCPGVEPIANGPCPRDGQVCEYPGCISQKYTCSDGKWLLKRGEPPP